MNGSRGGGNREQGFAMITAMLVIMIITLLIAGTISYAVGSLPISRHDQDWNAALSAAEGGVDDYVFRLNQNTNYWQYGDPPVPCPAAPAICQIAPVDGNTAFSFTGVSPRKPVFAALPGTTSDAKFHYSADVSTLPVDGIIKLTSTGVARKVSRTILVSLRQQSFLDFLYYTNYETVDPNRYTNPPYPINAAQAATLCNSYYPNRDPQCQDIQFVTGDTINGPLGSNDTIQINGNPNFLGPVTTSNSWAGEGANTCAVPKPNLWHDAGGGSSPSFLSCSDPALGAPMLMPPSNTGLKALTDPALLGTGCLFTGPTSILLKSDGTMTVTSPKTKVSNCPAVPPVSPWPTAAPVNMAQPVNGVVYVQAVPATATDPNYSAPCTILSPHPLGYPKTAGDVTTYGCGNGDAFISGVLKGQLTIGTSDNVIVTGNVTYNSGLAGKDILGLVATQYIQVYHPIDSSGNDLAGELSNPTIDAAMLSVLHSFLVPNWAGGSPKGTLTVNGAIAQNYRGPVGTHSGASIVSGYAKGYVYDQRLKYLTPPHFIDPLQSSWTIKLWSEQLPAAYPAP